MAERAEPSGKPAVLKQMRKNGLGQDKSQAKNPPQRVIKSPLKRLIWPSRKKFLRRFAECYFLMYSSGEGQDYICHVVDQPDTERVVRGRQAGNTLVVFPPRERSEKAVPGRAHALVQNITSVKAVRKF